MDNPTKNEELYFPSVVFFKGKKYQGASLIPYPSSREDDSLLLFKDNISAQAETKQKLYFKAIKSLKPLTDKKELKEDVVGYFIKGEVFPSIIECRWYLERFQKKVQAVFDEFEIQKNVKCFIN